MSIIRKAPFGHVVTEFLQSSGSRHVGRDKLRRGSVRLVFALALTLALAACDDDESSFVRPGEDSSSSVCEDCDDASSSSVKSNSSSSAKSSSSVKAKSSSSVRSSSSAEPALSSAEGGEDLSSSSVKSSSSSAKSSSSISSSSSAKSSSSVSSSSAKSSSSFLRKDYTSANHSYSELEDPRDHRVYKYLIIRGENKNGERDSVTVMAENLNVGIMVQGAEDQTDETKIEKYCYDNDTLNCYQYGGLYQWAEAMQLPSECNAKSCADQIKPNHRGICPEGWRLLTYDDFYIVVHADGNDAGVKGVRAMGFGGHNYNGYSLIGAGYNWGYKFRNLNESAYWHYPEEGRSNDVNIAAFVGYQTNSSTANSFQDTYKTNGFSIRCVKLD